MLYRDLYSELLKLAALKNEIKLKDYQERAVNKILDKGSLVVAHGTGTGKTVTSIAAVERLREQGKADKVLVVVPASLKTNYVDNGIYKFTDRTAKIIEKGSDEPEDNADYLVVSNTLFSNNPEKYLKNRYTLILDEGHNARNPKSKLYQKLEEAIPSLKNKVILTASPFNNSPGDLASLLNIVTGEPKYSPESINKFVEPVKKRTGFLGLGKKVKVDEKFNPDKDLKTTLKEYFDYEAGTEQLPDVIKEVVKVPMTPKQMQAYMYTWEDLPPAVKRAIKKDILPEKQDMHHFLARITNARLASNDPAALLQINADKPYELSDKALYLKENLNPTKGTLGDIIYSNYSTHAADLLAQLLDDKEVEYSKITGSMKTKKKDKEIKKFIEGTSKVLITTPTGKEGISIPNAQSVIIHDPHWNSEVTRQAIGRGARVDSIADKV